MLTLAAFKPFFTAGTVSEMAFGDAKLCDFYWEVQRQQSR